LPIARPKGFVGHSNEQFTTVFILPSPGKASSGRSPHLASLRINLGKYV